VDSFQAHGQRWDTDPALTAFVREVLAPGVTGQTPLEALPGARIVKHNQKRTVVRLDGPDGGLYLKRYRSLRLGERLLSLVRASPARREWRALRRLAERAVPCPTPVILGEERRGGLLAGCVLCTREAVDAGEVPDRVDALRVEGASRQPLAEALARTCRAVFEAGVDHPDLHLANFLVGERDDSLLVLDMHSARLLGGPLGPRLRLRRLGKLAHSFGLLDPDTRDPAHEELSWFAEAYAGLDAALGTADRLRAVLLELARGLEAVRLRSRDRRCLVDSSTYAVGRLPGGARVYRRREASLEVIDALLEAAPLATVHAHPRGRSLIQTVAADLGQGPTRLIRKRYLLPSLRRRVGALWRPLALTAWKAARACEVRFVPAPRHLALVLEGWLLPRRGTILMELLADVTMVHVLLAQPELPTPAARRALATELGRVMGRFHGAGLKHHDLAMQNVLVRARTPDAGSAPGWEVWIVDLDEVRRGAMSRKEKLRALTQLADLPPAATRADRARFFRAYLDNGGREVLAPELEAWGAVGIGRRVAEGLQAKAEAKARRQARRIAQPQPTNLAALE
jgi:Lipopolysaccharide kinase (Kdo/WaaP) family